MSPQPNKSPARTRRAPVIKYRKSHRAQHWERGRALQVSQNQKVVALNSRFPRGKLLLPAFPKELGESVFLGRGSCPSGSQGESGMAADCLGTAMPPALAQLRGLSILHQVVSSAHREQGRSTPAFPPSSRVHWILGPCWHSASVM